MNGTGKAWKPKAFMSSPPCVDIVIVNYFSARDVDHCLAQLGAWTRGTVWLVENSHDAAELQSLQAACAGRPWVQVLNPGANLGFGRGCNLAFDKSTAPLFLLLNPDARISTAELLALAEVLIGSPRLAAVSPRIYWNEQRSFVLPTAFGQTPTVSLLQAATSHARWLARLAARVYLARQRRLMASGQPFEVAFLAGAVLMLRRDAVLAAGGLFDPDYFMFYEDSDLSLRLRRAGFMLAMAPACSAVHEYRHKAFKAPLMGDSRQQYYRKRYPRFHAWTRSLARLDRLFRPVPLARWYQVLAQPCRSLADFEAQVGPVRVLAFSPSMLMMPAIFRPQGQAPSGFDEAEWALLEPASYVALIADDHVGAHRWIQFERAPEENR